MSSAPLGSSPSPPIIPPEVGAVASPKIAAAPPEKSEVDLINDRITALMVQRNAYVVKAEAGQIERGRLTTAKEPKASHDLLESVLEKVEKDLHSTDAAIEGEFKRLHEALGKTAGDEKERKAVVAADETPKAVKAAFEWEHVFRGKLEEEIVRDKLQREGALKGLSTAEADVAVIKSLKMMRKEDPATLEDLFRLTLVAVQNNAIRDKQFQGLGEIYLKGALPLHQRAKVLVRELNPAAKGVAGVGSAAMAGFEAITTHPKVRVLGTSANLVSLAGGAVLKKSSPKPSHEERLFGQVSKFFSGTAVLDSFHMASATPSRAGASMMGQKDRLRGISDGEVAKRKIKIKSKLTAESAEELEKFLAEAPKLKKEETSKEVASGGKKAKGRGVHYVPVLKGEKGLAYEKCEQHAWILTTKGKETRISFKEVHQLVLKEGEVATRRVRPEPLPPTKPPAKPPPAPPSRQELVAAVGVPWRAVLPSVVVSSVSAEGEAVETPRLLADFAAKVRINDMLIMHELHANKPKVLNKILQRLTPEAEHQMMLTLLLQTLDLHTNNIGLRPVSTPEYEAARNDPRYREDFGAILQKYLSGVLNDTSPLTLRGGAVGVVQTLRDHPVLLRAIESALIGDWELVLFDTDLSLDESNTFQEIAVRTPSGSFVHHMIPLRSGFLEVPPVAFKPAALALAEKAGADEANLRAWIRGDDRPIPRQLKRFPALKTKVEKFIQPMIDAQSLAAHRRRDTDTPYENLVHSFALQLSDVGNVDKFKFWRELEANVGCRTPKTGENLKDFAIRHQIEISKLLKLNPKLKNIEVAIPRGVVVRVKDLTSSSREAQKNRMKVAAQFFPRMTTRQQQALFARKAAQRDYLNAYKELQAFFTGPSKMDLEENRAMLRKYLANPRSPLSSTDKETLLKQLGSLTDVTEIRRIGASLVKTTAPSYFTMASAMYPYLRDAFDLAQELYGKESAGKNIGLYGLTLEMQIAEARKHGKTGLAVALANRLEAAIKRASEPGAAEPPSRFKSIKRDA